jgi:hypothetical protein
VFELTDKGRTEAERRLEEAGRPPWDDADGPDFRSNVKLLFLAYKQVMMAGNTAQVERANEILADARKQMYRLLADD